MIFFSQKINYQVLKSCTLYVVPTVPVPVPVPGVPGIWYLFESYKNLYTTWTPCTDGTYLYLCTIVANYGLHVLVHVYIYYMYTTGIALELEHIQKRMYSTGFCI